MAIYSVGRRRVMLLLVLTSIFLVSLDQRGNAVIDRSRSLLALALEPFDAAARSIALPVQNAWHGMVSYDDVRRENEALRAQIEVQRGAEIEARAAILEFEELLILNQLDGAGSYPSLTVRVQGERASNFQYTVQIDKGSTDGIEVGMPLVNGAGLVGKISQVNPNSSIVLLVSDPEFSIGAKLLTKAELAAAVPSSASPTANGSTVATGTTLADTADTADTATLNTIDRVPGPLDPVVIGAPTTARPTPSAAATVDSVPAGTDGTVAPDATTDSQTGSDVVVSTISPTTTSTTIEVGEIVIETGSLSGQGAGRPLLMRFVEDSASKGRVKVGAIVQTAGGIRSISPPGLPIGVVTAVREQTGSRALLVEVEPAANLNKLSFLSVVLYVPNTSGT